MKGFILLTDAARGHPDGTFSVLRGGIDRVHAQHSQPIQFRGSLVVRIIGSQAEAGEHGFQLRLLDKDDRSIAPDISGSFQIPTQGGGAVTVVDFALVLPAFGGYRFSLLVDQQELDSWEVLAVEAKPVPVPER